MQALGVQTPGAMADDLESHRVDAWQAGELVGGDAGQALVELGREVVTDVARRCRDDVEVVEKPLGSRGSLFAARYVFIERGVNLPQRTHVRVESLEVRDRCSTARVDGEQRGQPASVIFERLDPQQFEAGVGMCACMDSVTTESTHALARPHMQS